MKKLIIIIVMFGFIVYQTNGQSKNNNTPTNYLSANSIAIGDILKSLMPKMVFSDNWTAKLQQDVKEDDVIGNILELMKKGVRIDSLRIIDFKSSSNGYINSDFSKVSSGEFGRLISTKEGRKGITLLEFCEKMNCMKIAKIFMDTINVMNNRLLSTYKELLSLKIKAEKGDTSIQLILGNKLFDGIEPFEKDYLGAILWYQKAADKGSPNAQCKLANIYFYTKLVNDYDKAYSLYLKSAEQRNPTALNMVGMCYYYGCGVVENKTEAINWWKKASDLGLSNASCSLGSCYENGIGVSQDYNEALKWYKKAAELDNAIGAGCLGVIYLKGTGVPKDYDEAEKWFAKGVALGDENCRKNLEYVKSLNKK
jgi:TPR repeat protein